MIKEYVVDAENRPDFEYLLKSQLSLLTVEIIKTEVVSIPEPF